MLSNVAYAADEIINFQLDKNIYTSTDNITVSGSVYQLTAALGNVNLTISINGSEYNATTDINGTFEKNIPAPGDGTHTLILNYSDFSINKSILVSSINNIDMTIIGSSEDSYKYVKFTNDSSDFGITATGGITGNLTFANFSVNGTTFYAIMKNEDLVFDTVFISDVADFSSILYQYASQDTSIKIANFNYKIMHIDPLGKRMVIAQDMEPVFSSSGSLNLLILALNLDGQLIDEYVSLKIKQFNDYGEVENISNKTQSNSNIEVNQMIDGSRVTGLKKLKVLISDKGGRHYITVGSLGKLSYNVKKFKLKTKVTNEDDYIVSSVSPNQLIKLKATLADINNGSSIGDAAVNVTIVNSEKNETKITLSKNSNDVYEGNTTISSTGNHLVIFEASSDNQLMVMEHEIKVKNKNLFMKAFSKERGEDEGFSPNSNGILIIGGRDVTTKSFLNLSDLTQNCNDTKLVKISNDNSDNYLSTQVSKNLSQALSDAGAPSYIVKNMKQNFGEKACVVVFTTPQKSGTYKLELESNINGKKHKVKSYIDVTNLFAHGTPVNCKTGSWQESVSPGSDICIKVHAYDASNGKKLEKENITAIELIEVYSSSSGIVTNKVKNISVIELDGEKVLKFTSANNSIGYHNMELRVKANTSTGKGVGKAHSWYRTELWNVWAYSKCDSSYKFCNFGSDSDVTIKIEAYSAGYSSAKEGLIATLSSIRNYEVDSSITIEGSDSISCTTVESTSDEITSNSSYQEVLQPASCEITIPSPTGGWSSGGHEIKIKVTDDEDNSMYTHTWFSVENFRFYVWNRNWEATKENDLEFEVTAKSFDGSNIDANITLSKLYYYGSDSDWHNSKEIDISAITQTINGEGTYTINKSLLSNLRSGYYDAIFVANSAQGRQTSRAGFNIRSYIVVAQNLNDNWEQAYEVDGNLTFNVSAYLDYSWTYPPTGTAHNITNVTIKRINQHGRWDSAYKEEGKDDVNETVSCIMNSCLVTVPLSGYEQGHYDLEYIVTDDNGETSTGYYWFKTEKYTITTPGIHDWRIVQSTNTMTDKMSVSLNTERSCGTSSDSIIEPENVTSCIMDYIRLPTIYMDYEMQQNETIFLIDKTNVSDPIVYVNYYNDSRLNDTSAHNVFIQSTTQEVKIGDNFTDANGYSWMLSGIKLSENELSFVSNEGVLKSRLIVADNSGSQTEVEYQVLYLVNKSLSKSGKFLYSGTEDYEDRFWDDEWSNIDLDGDGKYNCVDNNGTWECEEYYIILSDVQEAGKYDTLLLSRTRNMTQGVNSIQGFNNSGNGDLRLNESASPIYLINLLYTEDEGVGSYNVITTTNTASWTGRHFGVFQVGDDSIRIPIMIKSPGSDQGKSGKQVIIRKIQDYGSSDSFNEIELSNPVSGVTNNFGIVIFDLNLSDIESGEYSILVEVNDSGTLVSNANDWEHPKLDLRSFRVTNYLGLKSKLSNIIEWSTDNNNLFEVESSEIRIEEGGVRKITLRCDEYSNAYNSPYLCHFDDYEYRSLWLNLTNSTNITLIVDNTPDDWYFNLNDVNATYSIYDTILLTNDMGQSFNYNVMNINTNISQISIEKGANYTFKQIGNTCEFLIVVQNISIGTSEFYWDVVEMCPGGSTWDIESQFHSFSEQRFLWDYFNVSGANSTTLVLNVLARSVELSPNIPEILKTDQEENVDQIVRYISDYDSKGFDVYLYNSNSTKTSDDMGGYTGTLDRIILVNITNSTDIRTYSIGDNIIELGKAVVKADPYDTYVYFSNLSIDGDIIYPLPWSCDDKKFYVGSFTEEQVGFKVENCYNGDGTLKTDKNYLLLFDSNCDGVSKVTRAMIDDDNVFDDRWVMVGEDYYPYDFYGYEKGFDDLCSYNEQNASENWIELGKENYPLSITNINKIDSGEIDLFVISEHIDMYNNQTDLSLWVQANNFDGTKIDGSILFESAVGNKWSCGELVEVEENLSVFDGNVSDGIGYLDMDFSLTTVEELNLKFKILDIVNPLKYEYLTKNLWIQREMVYEDCSMNYGGSGAGGSNYDDFYGDEGPEEGYDDPCLFINDSTTCDNTNCIWENSSIIPEEELEYMPPEFELSEMMCFSCYIYDYDKTSCEANSDRCEWHENGQYCDPIMGGTI
ncbi:hypothetical protein BVX95_00320 [archaeon D22]|nr:hypothetical protein BVX95_00320 [archaeon D22]